MTREAFEAWLKDHLDDPAKCHCPTCGGDITYGWGLAGGGLGPYVVCVACGDILAKTGEPGETFSAP